MASIIPPTIIRLRLLHHITTRPDWTHDRTLLVTLTQIVLHFSVILATIPCVKPWFAVLQGGGFEMKFLTRPHIPSLANDERVNLLPITNRDRFHTHRKQSVDEWQRIVMGETRTSTTIRFSPQDAWLAARRRSADSSPGVVNSIMKVDSFSVTAENQDSAIRGGTAVEEERVDTTALSVVPEASWETLRRSTT
nr:hypothetical protein CFP56_23805 [Quercus suber]